jgi:hypothetical protein
MLLRQDSGTFSPKDLFEKHAALSDEDVNSPPQLYSPPIKGFLEPPNSPLQQMEYLISEEPNREYSPENVRNPDLRLSDIKGCHQLSMHSQ